MKKEDKKLIENLMRKIKCSKNFRCYKSGLGKLCEAKDIGMNLVLVCKDKASKKCEFSVFFAGHYFCECPLRFYLAHKLKK